ncbi:MAG: alpha/beta fold hydrolase [Cyclobacteriaceae bacterium]|nr:alpha/beta hydrolase [Cytophagales bacterium]HNP76815.1 alpha/beta fold hydrolase [Cyclobacteriaceae bacterium]
MADPGYHRPPVLFTPHLETIYPALFRKVNVAKPVRERINTPDDDFLDLDYYRQGANHCVIISHGLEGNSTRAYIRGMAKAMLDAGFDVIAWNYRGCSGELNRQRRFYHSGATDDLATVVSHAAAKYPAISLVGFSLGGNLTLKYLGDGQHHPAISKAVAFSVPMDLYTSCLEISKPGNWIYARRFLKSLKLKVRTKAAVRTDLPMADLDTVNTLMEFDNVFTGPVHGFKDAMDYYTRCSSLPVLPNINVPTLVVNAKNDPFLSSACYPAASAASRSVVLEYPEHGGHVGFARFGQKGLYWSDMRAVAFLAH